MGENIVRVQFQPTGRRVDIPIGSTLLEAARWAGIELNSSCGGEGTCGQCQVIILEGQVSSPDYREKMRLSSQDLAAGRRLACRTFAQGNIVVEVPRSSITTSQRLIIESELRPPEGFQPDAPVRAVPLQLPKPSLGDARADFSRISDALRQEYGQTVKAANMEVIRSLPAFLRQNDWQVTAFVRGSLVVGLGKPGQRALGFSVDLGTTKIAASLVDLQTGQVLASAGAANPQLGYGEDVISRINFVQRNENGADILAEKVQNALDRLLGELVEQAGVQRAQVAEACIAGNTTMIHLLLRMPVRQLAHAPYVAVVSDPLEVPAVEIGLNMAPGALVYIPPSVGGFIGSDHIAMMLACDFDNRDKVTLGIDIGTNTEIVISKPGRPLLGSASCASGPAFEGAHIREGMRAGSGAIEQVRILTDRVEIKTIQNEPPVGLCGSGIIDTTAELFRQGLINRQGTFQRDSRRIREGKNGAEFVLVPAEQSGTGRDIVIDQKDINEIQLAKGAIHAGLRVLMEVTETQPEDVEEVIIAGAFGAYINIEQAAAIGLFPRMPRAVFHQVGNAALVGAHRLLISTAARRRATELRDRTQYLELTGFPRFNRIFAMSMLFPKPEENQ